MIFILLINIKMKTLQENIIDLELENKQLKEKIKELEEDKKAIKSITYDLVNYLEENDYNFEFIAAEEIDNYIA